MTRVRGVAAGLLLAGPLAAARADSPPPKDPDAAHIPSVEEAPSGFQSERTGAGDEASRDGTPETPEPPDSAGRPQPPDAGQADAEDAEAEAPDQPAEPEPVDATDGDQQAASLWRPFVLGTQWRRKLELGLSGSQGNTEQASVRANFSATRKSDRSEQRFRLNYRYATQEADTVANRFTSDYRFDKLMRNSRWRSFLRGSYENDQFQSFEHRFTGGGGFGYQLIKAESESLLARGGMSGVVDIGDEDSSPRAEAILGFDYSNQLDERNEVSATIDFLPTVTDSQRYRVTASAEWEILVDPERNLSLKLGGEERFDSNPGGGVERNDISYFLVLAVEF